MPELDSLVSAVAHPSQESSTPLASFLGSIYGDDPKDDDATAPRATEDTPSSSSATDPTDDVSPDATIDAADAPSAEPVAEPASTDPLADDDPLDGSRPLTYTVNGVEKTYEGITKLKDGAGIIDAEKMADLERKLGERDHLFEKSRDEYQSRHALETHFHTLTAWDTKPGKPDNVRLTGADGLLALREAAAHAMAFRATMTEFIKDPAALAGLLMYDEANNIVPNPQGFKYLEALLDARTTQATVRAGSAFRTAIQTVPLAARAAPEAPISIEAAALPTVEQEVSRLGVPFSPEDKQFFAGQIGNYVRDTTPHEKQQGLGAKIVDYKFRQMLEREARIRQDASKQVSTATTAASTVAQRNASRIAAATVGKKPHAKQNAPAQPARTKADELDDFYLQQESILAGAMRQG